MIKTFLLFILFIQSIYPHDKIKMLWFDATANFERFSYPDSISFYLTKAQQLGFTDVVIDIKPITGEVLYKSKIAPLMKEWNGFERSEDFDYLNSFIDESHKRNLKVHASLNVFVGGHNFYNRGIVYDKHLDWQSINYTDSGFFPITSLKHKYSAMLNPSNEEMQTYQLSIISEVVQLFPNLDGIILDRVRYDGIEADFSSLSKTQFENYIGEAIENFPDDIYRWGKDENKKRIRINGKYFNKWLEWRASIVYKFFDKARNAVKKINPNILFGDYAGAWYPVYYEVGVNWASNNYDPSIDYNWATEDYKNFGYAELLDFFTTGNYFFEVNKEEVMALNAEIKQRSEAAMGQEKEPWYSVEGSAEIANRVVMNSVPIIGGLYVEQYKENPQQFKRAVKMCLEKTNGVMIFDIVHIINYNWWEVLNEALH
mgnify:CR=1 FL=1